jgi:lipid-A-disaccharide synthase
MWICFASCPLSRFFKKHDYRVHYVGNPSVDAIEQREYKDETFAGFIAANALPDRPIIALLAGSRKQEISANLPAMLEAVRGFDDYQFIVAGAPGIEPEFYDQFTKGLPLRVLLTNYPSHNRAVVTRVRHETHSDLCWLRIQTPLRLIQDILHTPSSLNLICNSEV